MEINADNNLQSSKSVGSTAPAEQLNSKDNKEQSKTTEKTSQNPDFTVNLSKESLEALSSLDQKDKVGGLEKSQDEKLSEDEAEKATLQIKQELSGLNIGITGDSSNRLTSIFG